MILGTIMGVLLLPGNFLLVLGVCVCVCVCVCVVSMYVDYMSWIMMKAYYMVVISWLPLCHQRGHLQVVIFLVFPEL
jgi:hypothetical protein